MKPIKRNLLTNLLILFNILIWFSHCSPKINNGIKLDNLNTILGHWVIDIEKFEVALNEVVLNSPQIASGEKTPEEVKFGIKMVLGMYKKYYIIFSENSFEEYNPMGKTDTGKWKIQNNQLIRNYNMNQMLKQSIELFDNFKPVIEDFENPKDFELEMENHNNDKNDMLKELNKVSPFSLSANRLSIEVTSEGRGESSMIIPFELKRKTFSD